MLVPVSQYYVNDRLNNKSTSAYVYTVLNISDRDFMFSPNHICLLSMNAMTLFLTYFESRIMAERLFLIKKSNYAGCSLPYITKREGVTLV